MAAAAIVTTTATAVVARLVGVGNLGGGEILVILLVGLVVLGPAKLPAAVRQVGRFVGEIRRMGAGFRQELNDALEEPITQTKKTLAAADPRAVVKNAASETLGDQRDDVA